MTWEVRWTLLPKGCCYIRDPTPWWNAKSQGHCAQTFPTRSWEKQKTQYNQKARQLKLSEGEQVLLLLPDSTHKFYCKWQGPFSVKHQTGWINYKIITNPQMTDWNISNLFKKWFLRSAQEYSLLSDFDEDESITNQGNLTQEVKMGKNLSTVQQAELQGILKKFPNVLAARTGKPLC